MKILIVRNAYYYDFGGGERFPVHLAKELASLGHETVVVSAQPRLLQYAAEQGIRHRRGLWWSRQNWSGIRAILTPLYIGWQCILVIWYASLLTRERPDVLHLQSKDDFIAGTIVARLFRCRIVWTDHADLKHVFKNHQVWYKNLTGKLVYACSRWAHAVTLVSESEGRLIVEDLGHALPGNFTVIHNGVSEQQITPIERAPKDKDSVIFCSTSRLVTAKGIGDLIVAFRRFNKDNNVRLWLVGDGPEMEHFTTVAEGDDRIVFLGHQENPLPILSAADVFLQPTHHEGFSLSIVEATMLGKPLIVTNVGGNPEIADETNSILVPPHDDSSLFSAMDILDKDDALRRKLAKGSKKRFEAGFDFHTIVKERFVPLYEEAN
jgi:glycosyltransferase involved in cell wall biosynthesis